MKPSPPQPKRRNGILLTFQVSDAIKSKFAEAARKDQRTVSSWMRLVLCREAGAMEELDAFIEQLNTEKDESPPESPSEMPPAAKGMFDFVNRSVSRAQQRELEVMNRQEENALQEAFEMFRQAVKRAVKAGQFAFKPSEVVDGSVTLAGTKRVLKALTAPSRGTGPQKEIRLGSGFERSWEILSRRFLAGDKYLPWRL